MRIWEKEVIGLILIRVCVMIEFSSRGVQTMFLAYIGGLFWILSENENESTSHKKFWKNKKIYIIRFFKIQIFFYFLRFFCDMYSHFHFLTEFKKVRQYRPKTLLGPLLWENSIVTQTLEGIFDWQSNESVRQLFQFAYNILLAIRASTFIQGS